MTRLTRLSRSISGRRAVITGAGSGMGRATARLFADEGAHLCLIDRTENVLAVADEGPGVAPELRARVFDPYFTTKSGPDETGKGGTGLGLSTVYGIVKQSGGFIFADSEVGKGTKFTVYLPVHHASPEELAAQTTRAEPAAQWAGGGRILLVEDEDMVRAVAERALTRAGYTVTGAADGDEGLAYVEQGAQFDLVLSDVVMPGMDGPAMVRAIRARHPRLPVLFMSGYAEEQLRKEIDIANVHFLPKPFTVQQVTDKVGTVLAAEKA